MPLARISSNKENSFCRPAAAVRAKVASAKVKAKAGLAAGLGLGLPSRRLKGKRSTSVQRAKAANGKPKAAPAVASQPARSSAGYIKLPLSLARPALPQIAELELEGDLVPAAFVVEKMQPLLSGLLLAAALFQPYPGASKSRVEGRRSFAFGLPRAASHINVAGLEPDLCLALHRPGSTEALQIFPVHRLVYASQCAYFPALPLSYPVTTEEEKGLETIPEDVSECSSAASSDEGSDTEDSASEASADLHAPAYLHLPVLGLEVPSPETWDLVHVRLHSSDAYCWQKQLLNLPHADTPAAARKAMSALDSEALMKVMRRVHGAWQNCCAVGVTNEKVWEQLGSAWAVVIEVIKARAAA